MLRFVSVVFLVAWSAACKQGAKGPEVQAVFPTSEVLPENLLRMYIQFSRPMKTNGNLEKIKLLDEDGIVLKNVFFNNVNELWNEEQTQLTLLLDPARVKSGLKAHESFGPALKRDQHYTLIIQGLEDVNHLKMESPFLKKIIVGKADLLIPDIKKWIFKIPYASSGRAFEIQFPDMLDYHSLKQRLIITDTENKVLKGNITIEKQEHQWHFHPNEDWRQGNYVLHINTRLEDPCGNNLNGLFDHKIGALNYKKEGITLSIPFEIKNCDGIASK